jgi:hypothetical protein
MGPKKTGRLNNFTRQPEFRSVQMYKSVLSGTFEFPSRPGPPCAKITEVSPVEINSRAMGPNKPEAGAKSMTDVPAQPKPVPAAGTADRCQRHDLLVKIGDLASRLSFWRVRLFGLVP